MMAEVEPCTGMGLFIRNARFLELRDVTVEGSKTAERDLDGINELRS